MKSGNICSQCLRALRQAQRLQTSASRSPSNNSRLLSSTSFLAQQAAQQQSEPQSQSPPPPTTTSTVTSNVVASPTPSQDRPNASSSGAEPSTRQIQHHLRQSLTRPSTIDKLAKSLRKSAQGATETYITYGLTESLFKTCSSLVSYTIPESQRTKILTGEGPPKTAEGEDVGQPASESADSVWFKEMGLLPTFSTWKNVTYMHMYLLTVVLRGIGSKEAFQGYQQYLLEHFSQDAEEKMILLHTMNSRSIRNQYLKDLFLQWRGILAAYDEGMVVGDAQLGAAVWRNLFKGDEAVDWEKVGRIVGYMRACVQELAKVKDVRNLGSPGVLDGPDGIWSKSWRSVDGLESKDEASSGAGDAGTMRQNVGREGMTDTMQ